MNKIENPGADEAHGASDSVSADATDITGIGEVEQGREPKSRYDLIVHNSLVSLCDGYDGVGCIDCYDIVPDSARTDPAIGTVEMREAVFLCLVHIAESIIGGPPHHNVKTTIKYRYESLLRSFYPDGWGNRIDIDIVKQLICETQKNGEKGGYDGPR